MPAIVRAIYARAVHELRTFPFRLRFDLVFKR